NLVFNFNRRNPVALDAVNATMPPIVFPKPQAPAVEKPVESTSPAGMDSASVTKPVEGQTVELSPEQMGVTPATALDGTDTIQRGILETKSPKPYQLPGLEADIFYRIQIFSSSSGQRSAANIQAYFKLSQSVTKELSEGYYRYYIGEFENESEANQFVTSLRFKAGLKGAFVVKYINGTRELTYPK
ncbi:MAG: SPOR domain-containing protein, partial [Bacteroidia bacterium]|nr:SPOR domain-containing protein [Bacteroidia bacterium]